MSNERMTDARALLVLQARRFERHSEYDQAFDHIAARLRGEAAPYFKDADALVAFLAKLTELDGEGGDGFLPWRPAQDAIAGIRSNASQSAAPAPVAGDAVALDDAMVERGARVLAAMNGHERLWDGYAADARAALEAALAQVRPVAGCAVGELPEQWRKARYYSDVDPEEVAREHADELTAALAQDRASQAGAAGVPEGMVSEMRNFADVADRCNVTEGNAAAVIRAWADRLAAAPTPAAEAEVR